MCLLGWLTWSNTLIWEMGKLQTRGGKGPCQSAKHSVNKDSHLGRLGIFPTKGERAPRPEGSAACVSKGSWGEKGQWRALARRLGWDAPAGSESLSEPHCSQCLFSQRRSPAQLGLDQTHWVGCRKEWILVTLVCALEQDKPQDRSCYLQGPALEHSDCGVKSMSNIGGVRGDSPEPLCLFYLLSFFPPHQGYEADRLLLWFYGWANRDEADVKHWVAEMGFESMHFFKSLIDCTM